MFKSCGLSIESGKKRRFLTFACEVLHREFLYTCSLTKNIVDIEFISQGWHDLESSEMRKRLQDKIDRADQDRYCAILLGFGLCNNGAAGLRAGNIPLVIPKVHDCISILLGSHEKYFDSFSETPGTYYLSSGWIERDSDNLEKMKDTVMSKLGLDMTYDQYVDKYGKENADFIMESIGGGMNNYEKMIFLNNDLGDIDFYRKFTHDKATSENLRFEEVKGSLSFLQKFVDGHWDGNDFMVIEPGYRISATGLCDIMKSEKC